MMTSLWNKHQTFVRKKNTLRSTLKLNWIIRPRRIGINIIGLQFTLAMLHFGPFREPRHFVSLTIARFRLTKHTVSREACDFVSWTARIRLIRENYGISPREPSGFVWPWWTAGFFVWTTRLCLMKRGTSSHFSPCIVRVMHVSLQFTRPYFQIISGNTVPCWLLLRLLFYTVVCGWRWRYRADLRALMLWKTTTPSMHKCTDRTYSIKQNNNLVIGCSCLFTNWESKPYHNLSHSLNICSIS